MSDPELSVVIAVTERGDELPSVHDAYLAAIARCGLTYEVIYVLDERDATAEQVIDERVDADPRSRSIKLTRSYGDSTAIATGLEAARGDKILLLPPYPQIEATDIPKVVAHLEQHDVVVAERDRAGDALLNRVQARAYNFLTSKVSDLKISDTTCEVRALRREVVAEIDIYGDLHRFIPHLADRVGFNVGAVRVAQAASDRTTKVYDPGVYVRRALDALTALFLLRFTKKPLRFFGLIGITIMLVGAAILGYVIFERLFLGVELADRPPLFLGALAVVLGLQILAVGLVGEIVIFTHAKELAEYRVRQVVEFGGGSPDDRDEPELVEAIEPAHERP